MKTRKGKEIAKILEKKGFCLDPEKDHHQYYVLVVGGKKTNIRTYFSHGNKDYGSGLLSFVKRQLKFESSKQLEKYFECTFSYDDYTNMLKNKNII